MRGTRACMSHKQKSESLWWRQAADWTDLTSLGIYVMCCCVTLWFSSDVWNNSCRLESLRRPDVSLRQKWQIWVLFRVTQGYSRTHCWWCVDFRYVFFSFPPHRRPFLSLHPSKLFSSKLCRRHFLWETTSCLSVCLQFGPNTEDMLCHGVAFLFFVF